MKEPLYFAHGNGFPALCYKQMLDALACRFDCRYIDKVGHNPKFPVNENWENLILELIDNIQLQSNRPVVALGHSLGGVLSVLAAIKAPHLFKAVVLLDSPLIGGLKSSVVKFAKSLGVIDRITPAYRTRGRRQHWTTYEQLWTYLRSRDLFQTFTDACLNDYIQYGLEQDGEGYHLRFERHVEYQIYRTIPHALSQYKGQLIVPAALIYGDKSVVVDRMDRHYMKKNFNIISYKTKGSHLFPMENPTLVATQVMAVLDEILVES